MPEDLQRDAMEVSQNIHEGLMHTVEGADCNKFEWFLTHPLIGPNYTYVSNDSECKILNVILDKYFFYKLLSRTANIKFAEYQKMLTLLLRYGASTNFIYDNISPLDRAICNEDAELTHLLIQYGASLYFTGGRQLDPLKNAKINYPEFYEKELTRYLTMSSSSEFSTFK